MNFGDIEAESDFDTLVQNVPGFGGSSPPDVISSYDGVGGVTFAATPITIDLSADHRTPGASFDRTGGEVTVQTAGLYEIDFAASAASLGSRTEAEAWLEVNGVEIAGTRGLIYARQANHGATPHRKLWLDLTAGQVVRIRAQRIAGSSNLSTRANASGLVMRKW